MLQADKAALARELRLNMLHIQWKELEYLHANFQNLAVSSSVLVGFGFTALGFDTKYHPEYSTNHSSIWQLDKEEWGSSIFISEMIFQAMFSVSASLSLGFLFGLSLPCCTFGLSLVGLSLDVPHRHVRLP